MLPVLGAAARFLLANGRGEAVKKFGSKAINAAKNELKKRDAAMNDMARKANKGADKGTTKSQNVGFEKRRQAGREKRLERERVTGAQKADTFNPPELGASLNFSKGGLARKRRNHKGCGCVMNARRKKTLYV